MTDSQAQAAGAVIGTSPLPETNGIGFVTSPTLIRLAILILSLAIVYGVVSRWNSWVGAAGRQSTDDAYLQADITPMSAKVAGYVATVNVSDFQNVRSGEVLATIVDDDYRAQVAQAEASVAGAEAALENTRALRALQQSNVNAAEAAIAATGATLTRYRLEAVRQRELIATKIAGTKQILEQAEANENQTAAILEQNRAQLEAAKRQIKVYDAQEKQGEATLAAQRAALDAAKLNLAYTRIVAPADGMVGQRQVRPGQYAGVGTQIITLVPLPKVWVIANYKETQLTHLEIGQPATIAVDTFPGATLKGHVQSYSPASGSQFSLLPADNATGNFTKVVQRIAVKIVIDDAAGLEEKLRPGMSVITTIDTSARGAAPQGRGA